MFTIGNLPSTTEAPHCDAATALIFPAVERFIPPEIDRELARLHAGDWRHDLLSTQRMLRLELLQACCPAQSFQEVLRDVWQTWQCAGSVTAPLPCSSSLAEARARLPGWAMEALFKHSAVLAGLAQPRSPWPGHRLLSLDATLLPLPNTPALRAHFGATRHQHGEAYYPQALAVWLGLVTNGAVLAEHLGPSHQGEESIAPHLLPAHLSPGDLVLGDGRIGTYPTTVQTARSHAFFLFRSPGSLDLQQHALLHWAPDDLAVRLCLSRHTQQRHADLSLPAFFDARAVWFDIPARDVLNGAARVAFLTNLPRALFPVALLARLALLRWTHETLNNDIKTRLGLGDIRSQTCAGIRREVLAHLCLSNFIHLLLAQAQPDSPLAGSFTAARSALYHVNQQLRMAPQRTTALLNLIPHMIQQQPWAYRPTRSEPRMIRPHKRHHPIFKTTRALWRAQRKAR